eukprot:620741_1
MSIINCKLLQCSSIGQYLLTVFSLLQAFLLWCRSTIKVTASSGSSISINHTNFWMSIINSKLFQCSSILQYLTTVLSIFQAFLLWSRWTIEVTTGGRGGVCMSNTDFWVSIVDSELFQCSSISKYLAAVFNLLKTFQVVSMQQHPPILDDGTQSLQDFLVQVPMHDQNSNEQLQLDQNFQRQLQGGHNQLQVFSMQQRQPILDDGNQLPPSFPVLVLKHDRSNNEQLLW